VKRVVDLARECGFFDNVVVSTESKEVVLTAGTSLWHIRREEMCQPTSSVWDAVRHYMKTGTKTDYIMLLHLTSPCLKADTVKQAADMMSHNEDICDALASVNFSNPFNWSVCTYPPDFSKAEGTQFMPAHWELNNAIFIAKWDKLYEVENGYSLHWIPQCIPTDEAVDINDETDLHIAEAILQWRRQNEEETEEPSTEDL
jgi:CMP-N-acetylneuraminic acid synthetase